MIQILEQYFILNGHLDLSQIGALKYLKKEAVWQEGTIVAPFEEVIFEPIPSKPSRVFYNYLADELGISTDQAVLKFEEFINNIANESVPTIIGNLGTLHKKDNTYQWISNYHSSSYYNDIQLPALNENETAQTTHQTKNNWGIWALILTAISLALILYKQI